ncbi:MAG TPA: hypothetical protein VFD49_01630 [Candidatus Dormibacteraeota bacterium]|nr:hypothetical protein [Candidatus Dormibacteraeota bacterium]
MAVMAGVLLAVLVGVIVMAVLGTLVTPWLAWACLIYGLVAVLILPRRRRARRRLRRLGIDQWQDVWWTVPPPPEQVPPPPAPSPPPPPAPEPPPDPLSRLPLGARVMVEQIRHKAALLLQHADRFPTGSKDLFVLRRITEEYLPATLDAYLALPPDCDDRPVAPDGRTGLQVLRDQLRLLDAKLDEIADDLQRQNVDRLLANERFLEEHFGRRSRGDDELDLS